MAKKDHFLIIDTETAIDERVADFGAVLTDRKGRIISKCGVLIKDIYGVVPLFYLKGADSSDLWSVQGKDRRFDAYEKMLDEGTRTLASVAAVNRWLERCVGEYDPIVTAYNLAFDRDKCQKTGIDLAVFSQSFCLWYASANKWLNKREYRQFVLDLHEFTARTKTGHMSVRTNAETVAKFVLNDPDMPDEPHTALEDAMHYELPILTKLVNSTKKDKWMNARPISWQALAVRDWYKPK